MKISLASDHGGFELKTKIAVYLKEMGHTVVDYGTYSVDRCDYPDFAKPAALAVARGECERGIVVCTTGIGVSMVANKIKGVRCALCVNADMARMTRAHNNANMIALGQKYVDLETAKEIVKESLNTPFDGGVHANRVSKIED